MNSRMYRCLVINKWLFNQSIKERKTTIEWQVFSPSITICVFKLGRKKKKNKHKESKQKCINWIDIVAISINWIKLFLLHPQELRNKISNQNRLFFFSLFVLSSDSWVFKLLVSFTSNLMSVTRGFFLHSISNVTFLLFRKGLQTSTLSTVYTENVKKF